MDVAMTRTQALSYLPLDVPPFYHKKMMTCHHTGVGGVTTAVCRFVHYTRWQGLISYPLLMMSIVLPQKLQTALSDMHGALLGGSFESQEGMNPTEAIGVVSVSSGKTFRPVFSGDILGPDLALLPFGKYAFLGDGALCVC